MNFYKNMNPYRYLFSSFESYTDFYSTKVGISDHVMVHETSLSADSEIYYDELLLFNFYLVDLHVKIIP